MRPSFENDDRDRHDDRSRNNNNCSTERETSACLRRVSSQRGAAVLAITERDLGGFRDSRFVCRATELVGKLNVTRDASVEQAACQS